MGHDIQAARGGYTQQCACLATIWVTNALATYKVRAVAIHNGDVPVRWSCFSGVASACLQRPQNRLTCLKLFIPR